MGKIMPDARIVFENAQRVAAEKKRFMVLRLVEAQITGKVELSPEEMVAT